jgi:hypothetical protein
MGFSKFETVKTIILYNKIIFIYLLHTNILIGENVGHCYQAYFSV